MHISDERPEYLSRFDADDYYDNLVKAKIQCAMIYLQSHTGLCNFKAGQYTHRRFAGKNNEIMRLISKCRQGGIKTVGRILQSYFQQQGGRYSPRMGNGKRVGKNLARSGQALRFVLSEQCRVQKICFGTD